MSLPAGFDNVDLASLTHAYGKAEDVPRLVQDLYAEDAEVRRKGLWRLSASIAHQGTVYTATAYVVPYLLEAVRTGGVVDRPGLIGLLGEIANGYGYLEVHGDADGWEDENPPAEDFYTRLEQERQWVLAARKSVRANIPALATLIPTADHETVRAIAFFLIRLPDEVEQTLPLIRDCYENAKDETLKAVWLFCRAQLEAPDAPFWDELERMTEDFDAPKLLRFTAGVALAGWNPERCTPSAVAMMYDIEDEPGWLEGEFSKVNELRMPLRKPCGIWMP